MRERIILASASKRRAKILQECGIAHKVVISNATEKMDVQISVRCNVLANARAKAEAVAKRQSRGFVIGADTVVLLGKRMIGKPKTKKAAKSLLKDFSGKTIFVYTGLWVINVEKIKATGAVDRSRVRVKELTAQQIDRFIKIAGPHDKAGGFSIEGPGAFIFDDIHGSFYNILGLPLRKLSVLFSKLGYDLL